MRHAENINNVSPLSMQHLFKGISISHINIKAEKWENISIIKDIQKIMAQQAGKQARQAGRQNSEKAVKW